MAKSNPEFPHDMFKFLHRPLRVQDKKEGDQFLERFMVGPQAIFEDTQAKIKTIPQILDPAKVRVDLLQFLKDHVGFTKELNNITADLEENDLRKLISLAVALWKQVGIEPGYSNIVRLFTGKSARIFNWFDFRFIVGEKAFGEEQLGEDPWLISVPGVEASSDASNNVVDLITFEDNVKDRSLSRNNGLVTGDVVFFDVPSAGFPQGSEKFAKFFGGVVTQPNSDKYDFSGDFTIEMFIRTTILQSGKTLFKKMNGSGKGAKIEIDTGTNTINFELDDGSTSIVGSLTPSANIDDGSPRHLALVVDRANGVRLYFGGSESSSLISLGALGDVTNSGIIVIGGSAIGVGQYSGDIDNFRIALNDVYDVTTAILLPPITGFIEFQEEQLDEYFTDVRIVDEGDLNKTLILRILNLIRPVSERLNVIFIRFFDDFIDGAGNFEILTGSISVNTSIQLVLAPSTIVRTTVLNDDDFQDIVLQVKAKDDNPSGGIFSVLFFVQDVNNFYEYRVDTITTTLSLHKTVGGVSSQIGGDVVFDIVPQTSYVFTITTSFKPSTTETLIQTYLDSNRIHSVLDSSFQKGKFGMKTDGSTTMQVDEIEMLELPIDVQQVLPGFSL